jgi:uncharacterized membrane protein YqjE
MQLQKTGTYDLGPSSRTMAAMPELTLHDDSRISPRRVRMWLAGIVLAALALRCFNTLVHAEVIDRDTASFLYQAKSLIEGDAYRWFAVHTKPPLYSALIAAGWKLGLDPILAGRLVALLAGLLVLHPAWLLAKRCGPAGPALVGLAILALMKEPVQASGRCISDTTYAAIMTYALYFFIVRGLIEERLWAFPLAGALVGLAYLARTEGLMLLPLGLLVLAGGAIARKLPRRTALFGGLAMLAAGLAIVSVHVAMVSAAEGRFTLRRNMGQFMLYSIGATQEVIPSVGKGPTPLEVLTAHGLAMARGWLSSLWHYLSSYVVRCGGYVTGAFLVAGLAAYGRRLWRWQPCQLGLGLFFLSLCVLSLIDPHTRMLLGTISLTGYLMGAGVFWIHRQIDRLNLPGKGRAGSEMVIPGIAVAAVLAVSAASVIKFDPYQDSAIRGAASIVAANSAGQDGPVAHPRVAASEPAIAWYAKGEPAAFSSDWTMTAAQLHGLLLQKKADFLVLRVSQFPAAGLDTEDLQKPAGFLKLVGEARSDPRSKDKEQLLVYRVQAGAVR